MLTPADDSWTLAEAAHLINRAGFGANPSELRAIHRMGRHRALKRLIHPPENQREPAEPPVWTHPEEMKKIVADAVTMVRESRQMRRDMSPKMAAKKQQAMRRKRYRERRERSLSLLSWWFERMVTTPAPLREKMTLFWHDHFATSIKKVKQPGLMYRQNELLREHAFGSFSELTQRIASDPAMMVYLDTSNSNKANPNENFARELLELFTLGEGHYSEKDIHEAARAFTGYRLQRLTGRIQQNRNQHDFGEKSFLGETGKFSGPDIIKIVFKKKRPAHFIAHKLWAWFVNDRPEQDADAVKALAEVILANDWQMRPALEAMFGSEQFFAVKNRRNQIKSPVDFLAQLTKQLEVDPLPGILLVQSFEKLGQMPFNPPNVAGWKEGRAWINTNTLLSRYNIAGLVSKGATTAVNGIKMKRPMGDRMIRYAARRWDGPDYAELAPEELRKDPVKLVQALTSRLYQDKLTSELKLKFLDYAKTKTSKDKVMQDHEVAELVHLMTSTPHYQLT